MTGRPEWMDAGLRRGLATDPVLPCGPASDDDADVKLAKAVCWQCPVRRQCVAYALADPPLIDVWGATTADQRQAKRTRRRQLRQAGWAPA